MMNKIVLETEKWVTSQPEAVVPKNKPCRSKDSVRDALARAVVEASNTVKAKCIFVITQTGETSSDISRFRPNVPILTFIHCQKIGKQLQLFRVILTCAHVRYHPLTEMSYRGSIQSYRQRRSHTYRTLTDTRQSLTTQRL